MAGNQTTLLNEQSLSEFTDLVRRNWVFQKETTKNNAKQLFISDEVGAGQGNSKRYNEVDIETYADVKLEGTNFTKSKTGNGYSKDMIARTFGKEIEITLEMRNDNRYKEVGSYITNLNGFCEKRMDLDLTHRFTYCTSSSYTDKNGETVDVTVGDGNPLAYATHTLAFSSIQYRNRVTGDPEFSEGAYEAAKLLGSTQIYTNFGEKRNMDFNTIVTGSDPGTCRKVKQLLNSMADIDAAQSGVVNVYKDGTKHVILPDLDTTAAGAYDSTKRRWWFYLSTGNGLNGWQAYIGEWIKPTLVTPSSGNNGEDVHNLNWTYATYCRYGIVAVNGKGFIASCPVS